MDDVAIQLRQARQQHQLELEATERLNAMIRSLQSEHTKKSDENLVLKARHHDAHETNMDRLRFGLHNPKDVPVAEAATLTREQVEHRVNVAVRFGGALEEELASIERTMHEVEEGQRVFERESEEELARLDAETREINDKVWTTHSDWVAEQTHASDLQTQIEALQVQIDALSSSTTHSLLKSVNEMFVDAQYAPPQTSTATTGGTRRQAENVNKY